MAHASVSLSAFDRSEPERVATLARALESAGYRRLWASEHRTAPLSPSPTLVAAVAASVTTRLRVGTAGIMLRYASPRRVAEDFQVLGRLFPGRVDLGLIGGREGDKNLHDSLLDGRTEGPADYEMRIAMLLALLRADCEGADPQPWICSLNERSAHLAARFSTGLAYHHYLARQMGKTDALCVVNTYREEFRPCSGVPLPQVAVVCFGSCGDSDADAATLWNRARRLPDDARVEAGGRDSSSDVAGPDFLGSPDNCAEQLQAIAERFDTDDIVVHCLDAQLGSQVRQYQRLAAACHSVGRCGAVAQTQPGHARPSCEKAGPSLHD